MMNLTTYKKISDFNRAGVVWHGLSAERALEVLNQGFLKPHSVQRFWSDGMFYQDDHLLYDSSFWANGWCMSRDISIAKKFASRGIVFAFDINKIKQSFKVVPYSWGGAIPNSTPETRKREREEYVLSGGLCESENYYEEQLKNIEDEINNLQCLYKNKQITLKEKKSKALELKELAKITSFSHHFNLPHGSCLELKKAFGFFVSEKRPSDDICIELEKHPLFLGYL